MNKHISRREFLQVSSASTMAAAAALSAGRAGAAMAARGPFRGTLCMFSKPVPQLSWRELARRAKAAGFGGIDLTVRPEGHVLPERAETDLPKAVDAIRGEGLEVPIITTELITADDPTARPIFRTASKLSIPFVKPGYYYYKLVNVVEEIEHAGRQFRGLVALAGGYGLQVGYHNHPHYIGEGIWDMARVIEPMDARKCGYYFDLSSATEEGGVSGWQIATNLVIPRLKMVAAKDFSWQKVGPNRWEAILCPMGQGMVRWREFMHTLSQSNFHGPISYQHEYIIPGVSGDQGIALSRATVPQVMSALKQNLDYIKSVVREAYGEA